MVFQIHRTRSILIFIGILIALIAAGCNTSSDVSHSTDVITLPSTNSVSAQPVVDSNASDYDIVMSVITSPTGAAARAASAETWWRRMIQISEATSIISQALIAISALGTCR